MPARAQWIRVGEVQESDPRGPWPPATTETLSIRELCKRAGRHFYGLVESPLACRQAGRAEGMVAIELHQGSQTEVLVAAGTPQELRGPVSLVYIDNTGGSHPSGVEIVGLEALRNGVALLEVKHSFALGYPTAGPDTSTEWTTANVCRVRERQVECSQPLVTQTRTRRRPTGHPATSREEEGWWRHRVVEGEGDSDARVEVSDAGPGVLLVELVEGRWEHLGGVWADPGVLRPGGETESRRYIRYAADPPRSVAGFQFVSAEPSHREDSYDLRRFDSLESHCARLARERLVECAVEPVDRHYALLHAFSGLSHSLYLALRRGSELAVFGMAAAYEASPDRPTEVRVENARRLGRRRVAFTLDVRDETAGGIRRHLLLCEPQRRICSSRVPLRWMPDASPREDSEGRSRLIDLEAAEARAHVDGDVLELRLVVGGWDRLFEDPRAEDLPTDDVVRYELP